MSLPEDEASAARIVAGWAGITSMDAARAVLVGIYCMHEDRKSLHIYPPKIWDVEKAWEWADAVIRLTEEVQRRPK